MGRLDAPNPLGYSCAGVADDLLRVRFGMNLPEPDSFVVVACPDTEIGFSWEGGNRLKIGDGFIFFAPNYHYNPDNSRCWSF